MLSAPAAPASMGFRGRGRSWRHCCCGIVLDRGFAGLILAGLILAHFTLSAGNGTIGFRGFRFDRAKLITRSPDQDQLLPLLVGTGLGLREQEGTQASLLLGAAANDDNLARLENQACGQVGKRSSC